MKKIIILLSAVMFSLLTYSQAVVDNAVIPVSVSLNSILRLNVTSGGAIEFVVSSMNQYNYGIDNTTRYTTAFTVASSVDFDVNMYAENDALYGTQEGASEGTFNATDNSMPLDLIGYYVVSTGSGVAAASGGSGNWGLLSNNPTSAAWGVSPSVAINLLTNSSIAIVQSNPAGTNDLGGAGGTDQNSFEIQWELATSAVTTANGRGLSLLQESLEPDYYTTNVFLELRKQ